MQLTAGRRDDQFEFIKHIVAVANPNRWQFLPRIRQGTVRAPCGEE